jgi:transcriptional regulator of acetoin/glycerol metabolism
MVVAKNSTIAEPDICISASSEKETHSGKSLDDIEKEHIRLILGENRWNIVRSAQVLGIDRVTLYNKIKKYGLKREQETEEEPTH